MGLSLEGSGAGVALRSLPGAGCARLNAHILPWWVLGMWLRPPSLNFRQRAPPSAPRGVASFPPQDCAGNDLFLPPTPVSEAYPQPGQPVPPAPFLGHHLRLPSSQCLTVLSVPPLPCHPSVSQRVSRQGGDGVGCPPGGRAVSWLRAPPWYPWVVPTSRWSLQGLGELVWCRRRCREPAGLAAHVEGGEAADRL